MKNLFVKNHSYPTLKFSFILLFLYILYGCDNSLELIDSETMLPTANLSQDFLRSAGDGQYDVLGHGYDCAFSDFKGSKYSKARVLDLERFISGQGRNALTMEEISTFPGNILPAILSGGIEQKYNWGANLNEYQSELTQTSKTSITVPDIDTKGSLYSSELSEMFTKTQSFSNKHCFYRIDSYKTTKRLTMSQLNPEQLKLFLTDEFIYDMNNYSGEDLVNKYGTHVLTDILLGGMNSVVFNAKLTSSAQASSFKVEAKNTQNKISTNSTVSSIANSFSSHKDVNIHIRTIGGRTAVSPEMTFNPFTGEMGDVTFKFSEWLNSVDLTSCQIIGIGNITTTIYPLSDFIPDQGKKQQVEQAITAHINKYKVKMNTIKTVDYEKANIHHDFAVNGKMIYFAGARMPLIKELGFALPEEVKTPYYKKMQDERFVWTFYPEGNYYSIAMNLNGMLLFLTGGTNNSTASLFPYGGGSSQLWDIQFIDLEKSLFYIRSVSTNLYLGVDAKFYPFNPNDNNMIWKASFIQ